MTQKLKWYFDYISPFAYLQHQYLRRLHTDFRFQAVPILFAGLLNEWGQKGPAEIPAKRIFTYQHAIWLGKKLGIPLSMPPAHPFNPLPALRLSIALDNQDDVIDSIFRYIWAEGKAISDDGNWLALMQKLGVDDADALCNQNPVKQQLKENTEQAIRDGVFGVPTFVADEHLFWGFDATDMFIEYQNNPQLFKEDVFTSLETLPVSAERK